MAARGGVVDTSVFKGVADLHAEVLSNDPVVAPAHEVVQDSDLIADSSIHSDAVPDHSDTAATSTGDATAEDTGHVHADLAYADTDHGYADVDHAYADVDHGVADVDHAYADHAFADAAVPDSAFTDHSMLMADAGTPHSLGADAAKGQDDGHNAAAWWWVGGAALAAGGIGYWIADEHNDDSSSHSSTAASPDVHVVVESAGNAYIDTNGDGVHQSTEDTVATFGHGGTADLDANSVTVHFNGTPFEALDLTGFGADDKIEFHMEAMVASGAFGPHALGSYLTDLTISHSGLVGSWAAYYPHATVSAQASIDIHQTSVSSPSADMAGNPISDAFYIDVGHMTFTGLGTITHETAIAFWTDAGNALNDNAAVFPTWTGSNTSGVRESLNANNEGGVVDFIWPSTPVLA